MTDTSTTQLAKQDSHEDLEPRAQFVEEWGSPILLRFARDLQLSYSAAVKLVQTTFVPATYKGKPEEAAAAIVKGLEVGLAPLMALDSIDIIQGRPAMRAVALRALVQAHGHEIWIDESNSQRAIVKGRRKGSDRIETSMWDIDRARAMQLLSKDNWKKQPESMLIARATSEIARRIDADGILGLAYTTEELSDGVTPEPEEGAPAAAPKAKRTTIARKKPAQALKEQAEQEAPEPAPEVEKEAPPEETAEVEPTPEEGTEPPEDDAPMALVAPDAEEPFTGNPLGMTREEQDEFAHMPEGFR